MKVSLLIQFKLSCSASSARDAGTLRPRCSYALRVTQRPRGVRVRKPSCMRYGSYTSSERDGLLADGRGERVEADRAAAVVVG